MLLAKTTTTTKKRLFWEWERVSPPLPAAPPFLRFPSDRVSPRPPSRWHRPQCCFRRLRCLHCELAVAAVETIATAAIAAKTESEKGVVGVTKTLTKTEPTSCTYCTLKEICIRRLGRVGALVRIGTVLFTTGIFSLLIMKIHGNFGLRVVSWRAKFCSPATQPSSHEIAHKFH